MAVGNIKYYDKFVRTGWTGAGLAEVHARNMYNMVGGGGVRCWGACEWNPKAEILAVRCHGDRVREVTAIKGREE